MYCVKIYRKYFSMDRRLKLLTLISLLKRDKIVFVCLSCCKENECIFQKLLELRLNSKNTCLLKKKNSQDWKEEKSITHHFANAILEHSFHYYKHSHYWSIFQMQYTFFFILLCFDSKNLPEKSNILFWSVKYLKYRPLGWEGCLCGLYVRMNVQLHMSTMEESSQALSLWKPPVRKSLWECDFGKARKPCLRFIAVVCRGLWPNKWFCLFVVSVLDK
jgi:hypothetical protein